MFRLGVVGLVVLLAASSANGANPGRNGRIAFVRIIDYRSYTEDPGSIWTVRPDGTGATRITRTTHGDTDPAWSPDGRRIAFIRAIADEQAQFAQDPHEIFVVNADGTGLRRLTRNHVYDGEPTWSPDGRRIAFVRGGPPILAGPEIRDIWVMRSDGSRQRSLGRTTTLEFWPAWGPRGRTIAYVARDLERRFDRDGVPHWERSPRFDLWTMRADGRGRAATGVTSTTFRREFEFASDEFLTEPDWSPNGRRIVAGTARGVAAFRPDGEELSLFEVPYGQPSWSPDGREIAVARPGERDGFVYALDVTNGAVRQVTTNPFPPESLTHVYDLDPTWQPVR